uniref:DNA topoisomerase n=1 Tax=viral metagenome TaxID=1070528 RepID=A0A6C0AQ21_9ZZZZ
MKLVIVESPAKCSKIQGFLGPGYIVKASMGHIRALEEALDAVGLTTDFEPRFQFIEAKSRVQKDLKDAAKGAEQVYLAADDDREGEAIAYSVALLLKLPLATTPRIVFHEITQTAIQAAMEHPRRLHMDRIYAQQARSMLDMMIGFTLSPILWNHVARGLSAGRCQTPALKLVVEKERQIQAFKAASSWRLTGEFAAGTTKLIASLQDELEDEADALNFLENCYTDRAEPHIVNSNVTRPWSSNAPDPLITSTLQQQASALFSFSPKTTMLIAQKLYEGGHITYMRTDKAVLSEEAIGDAKHWVTETFGLAYVANEESKPKELKEPKAKKSKKGPKETEAAEGPKAQEAHEAIRPTHMEIADISDPDPTHKKLYGLIRQRAIQSVMSKATGETCTVTFHRKDDADFPWTAKWRRTTFQGWQRMGKTADLEETEEEADASATTWTQAQALIPMTTLTWTQLQANPHETKPAGRFTEATLVRELESHGIGRPSTFSSLLSAIQDRGYAEITDIPGKDVTLKTYSLTATTASVSTTPASWPPQEQIVKKKMGGEKKKLVPTALGLQCLSFLEKHFPHLFDYKFTSQMETRLDLVEKGTEPWKQVLRDTWATYKDKYESMKSGGSVTGSAVGSSDSSKVKTFSNGLKAVMSKKGPLILQEGTNTVFYGWPSGVVFDDLTEADARAFVAKVSEAKAVADEPIGTFEGQPVLRKTGKFGPYIACGTINLSVLPTDSWSEIEEKLKAKAASPSGTLKTFKDYEIRNGPYGPYMFKTSLKKKVFVSIPKSVDINTITEATVADLYKSASEAKKAYKKA